MRCRIEGGMIDYSSGLAKATISTKDRSILNLDREKEYTITMKPYRPIRTNDQNAYFHVLVGALASAIGVTETHMKNNLIMECGAVGYEYDIDGCIRTEVKPKGYRYLEDHEHLVPLSECTVALPSGKTCQRDIYMVKKRTRDMDTAEFSQLVEMTIEICKEFGISTEPIELTEYYDKCGRNTRS